MMGGLELVGFWGREEGATDGRLLPLAYTRGECLAYSLGNEGHVSQDGSLLLQTPQLC